MLRVRVCTCVGVWVCRVCSCVSLIDADWVASVNIGKGHFVMLNSEGDTPMDDAQLQWLEADLDRYVTTGPKQLVAVVVPGAEGRR